MSKQSEIHEQVKKYLLNPAKIEKTHARILYFLFHTPLEMLFPNLENLPPSSVYSILSKKSDRVKTALDLDLQSAFPFATIAEGMEKETETAIAEFVSSIEVSPSKKLLIDLLGQKAIQDIIANIIESGIIEFSKKTNPLFGMIQATGLDKQIKSFINLFLPNFLPKIADFLHTTSFGDSSTLAKDVSFILMNAQFSELNLPNDDQIKNAEEKLKLLTDQIDRDSKLEQTIKNFTSGIRNRFLEKFGKDRLVDFLNLSEDEFQQFNVTLSKYLSGEFINYHKQNPVDVLMSEIIADIILD
jgi:hypothetical protein